MPRIKDLDKMHYMLRNYPAKTVATYFDCSLNTVTSYKKKCGFPLCKTVKKNVKVERVAELFNAGKKPKEIAAIMSISIDYVYKLIRRCRLDGSINDPPAFQLRKIKILSQKKK